MTWSAFVKLMGGMRATVFAGIAALLLVIAGIQTYRIAGYPEKVALLEQQVATWRDANESNVKAIEKLKEANAAWGRVADARKKQAEQAAKSAAAERDRLLSEIEKRRAERGRIYERDPSAAAWGRERVPDAVARQLRRDSGTN